MNTSRTFLRWAGSKKKLLPKLVSYWGNGFTRYIEPFMGSAAMFFSISPNEAFLSDINSDLVQTFCAVRDHQRAVYNRLVRLPLGEKAYYLIRQQDPSLLKPLDLAARFVYLNRFCFNGLYRTNTKGQFNVPYATSKTARLPALDDLYSAAKTLSHAQIEARDFEEALGDVRSGDFVYMDPPYAVQNRRVFRQYGPDSFGTEDIARLASALHDIDRRGATFLVSYAMCREALESFGEWHVRRTVTQRCVAGFQRHRRKAVEILVTNRENSE